MHSLALLIVSSPVQLWEPRMSCQLDMRLTPYILLAAVVKMLPKHSSLWPVYLGHEWRMMSQHDLRFQSTAGTDYRSLNSSIFCRAKGHSRSILSKRPRWKPYFLRLLEKIMFWKRTLGVTGNGGGNVGRVTLLFFNGHGHSRLGLKRWNLKIAVL